MDGDWRMACVTRARTVAAGVRFIEFALSGAPVALETGATADLVVGPRGGVHTFACLPAEPGSLRILVPRASTAAARFMWALVEGAHVRARLSRANGPQTLPRQGPAIRGLPAVRLVIGASASRHSVSLDADAAQAAAGVDARRAAIYTLPYTRRRGEGAGAGHDKGRTGAGKSSTV